MRDDETAHFRFSMNIPASLNVQMTASQTGGNGNSGIGHSLSFCMPNSVSKEVRDGALKYKTF